MGSNGPEFYWAVFSGAVEAELSWSGQLYFCSSLSLAILGKASILVPHVGHWSFVCKDASPPSVWRFHTILTIARLSWKYTGWRWQQSYSGGKREQREGGQLVCFPLSALAWCSYVCWLNELWPKFVDFRLKARQITQMTGKKHTGALLKTLACGKTHGFQVVGFMWLD